MCNDLTIYPGLATYPLESRAKVTEDFFSVNELLEFTGGVSSHTVSISIVNDNVPENTETIVVKLSNPINAYLGEIAERKAIINVLDLDCEYIVTSNNNYLCS